MVMLFAGIIMKGTVQAKNSYTENGMTYSISNEEAMLIKCNAEGSEIAVPSEVNGYKVTCIGVRAFVNSKYTSIVLPDTVTDIESNAFSGCEELENITLSPDLKTIGEYSFGGCVRLKSVNIGKHITDIPVGAFSQCISFGEKDWIQSF